jgi:[acyl-carrier-protein] S-malonyltransferase
MNSNQLAFVFPGQGSQKVGMLAEIADAFPIVTQTCGH